MLAFLKRILYAIAGFFGSFFQAEVDVVANIQRLAANFQTGKEEITTGIEEIKQFKFDPKWRSRVINVPDAAAHLQDLYESLFGDLRDRLETLRAPIHAFVLIFKAEQLNADDPGHAASGLARTAAKLQEVATLIAELADASDTALDFVEAFNEVIMNLESLDAIFLQQRNKRKVETLKSRIRLGKLHS
jgi:hypothetical protein